MAAQHPRIGVITVPRVRSALERISAVTGTPMGTIVREMLEQALPALNQMADALEAVPKNPGEALAKMAKVLEQASVDTAQMGLELGEESKTLVQRAKRKARQEARRKAARE
jgi:hypothetical protein